MKKIVYLADSFIPSRTANSVHVMNICHAFANLGYEVLLLASPSDGSEDKSLDPFRYYGIPENFSIRLMDRKKYRGEAYVNGYKMARIAYREKPDLVVGRSVKGIYFALKMGMKVVFDSHFPMNDQRRVTHGMFTSVIRHKNTLRFTVNCQTLADYYEAKYDLKQGSVVAAHNGSRLDNAAPVSLATDRLQVGYLGSSYQGRGIDVILGMAKASPWADFHVVGAKKEDIDNEVPDNIRFYGFLPPSETASYRNSFDVLLAPYQQNLKFYGGKGDPKWMSPIKLFEYMSTGKAIMVSDFPVIHEIFEDRKDALLVKPDQLDDWVSGLEFLRDHPEERIQIGERSFQKYQLEYTWEARAKKMLQGLGI